MTDHLVFVALGFVIGVAADMAWIIGMRVFGVALKTTIERVEITIEAGDNKPEDIVKAVFQELGTLREDMTRGKQ